MFIDGDGDRKRLGRYMNDYLLRVISPSGALIREGCEIDSSRVVILAPMGTIIRAQERWIGTAVRTAGSRSLGEIS